MVSRRLLTTFAAGAALTAACTASPHDRAVGIVTTSPDTAAPVISQNPLPPRTNSGYGSSRATPVPALTATTLPTRLPVPLSRLVAVPLDGRIVIAGGLDAQQRTTSRTEVFEPGSSTMTSASRLPVAVHDAGAGAISGEALVVGGGAAVSDDTVQMLQADGTARVVGHLPQPRSDDTVAVDGTTLYVVGGYDGRRELPAILATSDGTHFRQVGQLKETVRYAAAVAADGSIWVFGGEHNGSATAVIQRVNTTTGSSTVVAGFPHPLAHAAAVVLGQQMLVIGGTDGRNPQSAVYSFDPRTDSVHLVGSLPEAVSDAASVVLDGTAYVIGGEVATARHTIAPTASIVAVRLAYDPYRAAQRASNSGDPASQASTASAGIGRATK